jgi:hypothetical protein
MAIQRRVNWISQERVDVPAMRSIESAMSNDLDQLIQSFVTGDPSMPQGRGYVLRGFELSMTGAIGGAASGLQMVVDPGALFHIEASQSGTTFMVPAGTPNQTLNSATNTNVTGAFTPNAINYVGIDYSRLIDPTTDAEVYIWDPTTNSETTLVAPTAVILEYDIIISTTVWPSNVLPIAVVVTDAGNNVLSITDSRWLLFRLGTGGTDPNPFYVYPWTAQPEGRTENPPTSTSDASDPFEGGDKMLMTLKDWMNAIMSSLLEIKGTTYWYSLGSAGSIVNLREDLGNTVVTGAGSISHGILPNTSPVLTTTGNIAINSNQLTSLASTAGIVVGQFIMGNGIPVQTTVLAIAGSTVTMSNNATETLTGISVAFYAPNTVTGPGQVNWDQGIFLDVIGTNLAYEFLPNPTSANIVLSNDEVAYVNLVRGQTIIPNLIFTNGSAVVQSVGSISWTTGLEAGDYVRLVSDTDAGYYEILSVDSLSQVTLVTAWAETSTGASGAQAVYAYGSYANSPTPQASDRYIHIAARDAVPTTGNMWWFLLREDNGGSVPTVYVRFIGEELREGDTNIIDDGFPKQVLQYIGSPSESTSLPNYTAALSPGAVPQVFTITTGAESTITTSQYFYVSSSANARQYYVWFQLNGVGADPMPIANRIGVKVPLTTGQTAAQVATAIEAALQALPNDDFSVSQSSNVLTVTNTSAGTCTPPSNQNVSAPFAIAVTQNGTGVGNNIIHDGDNLTLAIKELDEAYGAIIANADNPNYDEPLSVISGVPANSNQVQGPISANSDLTLPNNSRESEMAQYYTVGLGSLMVFLNGQYLDLNENASMPGTIVSYGMTGPDTSYYNLVTGATEYAIQYTPSANVNLTDVKFKLVSAVLANGAVGNIFSTVMSDSSGQPSGTILGTSSNVLANTVGGSVQAVDFNYGTPVALTAGTPYWFILTGDSTYFAGTYHLTLHGASPNVLVYPTSFFNGTSWTSLFGTPGFELDGTSTVGQFDWTEVGSAGTLSNVIQINRNLVVGDVVTFRINVGSGGSSGGGGGVGPQGPPGANGSNGLNGSQSPVAISTKTSSYTVMVPGDVGALKANCAGGAIIFTLPTAASATGLIFYFKKIDSTSNLMTVKGNGAELIDGLNVQSTSVQYTSFTLISDGTTWSLL